MMERFERVIDAPRAFMIAIGAGVVSYIIKEDIFSPIVNSIGMFLSAPFSDYGSRHFDANTALMLFAIGWVFKLFFDDYYYFKKESTSGRSAIIALSLTLINFAILVHAIRGELTPHDRAVQLGAFLVILIFWNVIFRESNNSSGNSTIDGARAIIATSFDALLPFENVKMSDAYKVALKNKKSRSLVFVLFSTFYIFSLFHWAANQGVVDDLSVFLVPIVLCVFMIDYVTSGTFVFHVGSRPHDRYGAKEKVFTKDGRLAIRIPERVAHDLDIRSQQEIFWCVDDADDAVLLRPKA